MAVHENDLVVIATMDRSQLLETWAGEFGPLPGPYISMKLMRSMLAYQAQTRSCGGLPKQAARALAQRSRQLRVSKNTNMTDSTIETGRAPSIPAERKCDDRRSPPLLRPGVHLLREWNGRTYRVEVTDDGFNLDGKSYKSLTAIARRITGAHWSGPRFFGIARR